MPPSEAETQGHERASMEYDKKRKAEQQYTTFLKFFKNNSLLISAFRVRFFIRQLSLQ